MWTRCVLALTLAAGIEAQSSSAPVPKEPDDLLRFAQGRVNRSSDRLPRYMCTETIDRTEYEIDRRIQNRNCEFNPEGRDIHISSSDRLRLDVAMAVGFEMFAWYGERQFTDRDLMEIVHEGAVSTGSFGAFLIGIFHTRDATFSYNGESSVNGHPAMEFGFRVPYEKSRYRFGSVEQGVITAYDGTFLVNPKDGDLEQLTVRTARLPPETGSCFGTTTLDYTRVRMKDETFLLPRKALLRIVHPSGIAENRMVFSNCHEFLGESSIRFDAPESVSAPVGVADSAGPHAAVAATRAPAALELPPGLPFRVRLTQGLDTAVAAAGDTVQAQLLTAIEETGTKKVLVPAYAAVIARIIHIQRAYGKDPVVAMDIRLETVQVNGVTTPFFAKPDHGQKYASGPGGAKRRQDLGSLRNLEERTHTFIFRSPGAAFIIPTRLQSDWVTAVP